MDTNFEVPPAPPLPSGSPAQVTSESSSPKETKPVRVVRAVLGSSPRPTMTSKPDNAADTNAPEATSEQGASNAESQPVSASNPGIIQTTGDIRDGVPIERCIRCNGPLDAASTCSSSSSSSPDSSDIESISYSDIASSSDSDSDDSVSDDPSVHNGPAHVHKKPRMQKAGCNQWLIRNGMWLMVITAAIPDCHGYEQIEVIDSVMSADRDRLLQRRTDFTIGKCIDALNRGAVPPPFNTVKTPRGNRDWFIPRRIDSKRARWQFNPLMDIDRFPTRKFMRFAGHGTDWWARITNAEII